MENYIQQILNRKKQGIDCAENESAEIKGYLRGNETKTYPILQEIEILFPIEYDEFLTELEIPNATKPA